MESRSKDARATAVFDLREIARLLGGTVSGSQVLAPGPGHSRRDRSVSVMLSPSAPEGFVVASFAGDDFRLCRDYVRERLGIPRWTGPGRRANACSRPLVLQGADAVREARSLVRAAECVQKMRPVRGTPGERYLREIRRIDTEEVGDVLERVDAIGWRPQVYFHEPDHPLHGHRLGCIIGVMTDPVTARPTGAISRTYIDEDLHKIGKAKTLGSPAGIVRLSRDEDVHQGLYLAEGLETALSAMAKGLRPVWSTGSTALMKTFPVLDGIDCLTVIADHDATDAGEEAAREVEMRWRRAGREANILMPSSPGDLNDLLRRAKG
jgi:putative DNA primase/helicase